MSQQSPFRHIFLLLFTAFSGNAVALQQHDAIYAVARSFVESQISGNQDFEINLSALDPRLQLPDCPEPLKVSSPNPAIKAGKNAINVRCSATQSWSIYLSAEVKIFAEVLVSTQAIKRGEILKASAIGSTRQELSQLRNGYTQNLEAIENLQAIHDIEVGKILSPRDFKIPLLIKQGDNVIISTHSPHFSINMSGIALGNAAKGQRIRVKNTESGRVIQAIAEDSGKVSVNF